MSIWTIKIGTAAAVDPATLDLYGLKASILTQAPDTLTVTQAAAYDADPAIPYGTQIILYRDGARWFQGTCTGVSRKGSGQSETIAYTISGPWWQLEQITYEQAATRYLDGEEATVVSPRVILGSDADGNRVDSAATITEALQFALDALGSAAQFAIGTINAPAQIPWDEVTALTCAEVVRRVLRYAPDRVAWYDYSTATPTLNIVPRSSLTALSYEIGANLELVDNAINPRNDLQNDGVVITYERTDSIGGQDRRVLIRDSAGTTTDPLKTLRLYIDLAGAQVGILEQDIKTATIQKDSAAWWSARHAKLKGATGVSIANATQEAVDDDDEDDGANDGTSYAREIMSGSVAEWMAAGVNEQIISADVTYTPDGGSSKTERLRLTLNATSAATGKYTTVGSATPAEPTPVGLAAAILASISTLQYDGSIILTAEEVAGTPHIARRINLTGGRTEWATMAAQVYHVDYDIDQGATNIRFGVAKHLSPSDLLTLYRAARDRRPGLAQSRASSTSPQSKLPDRGRNTSTADDGGDTFQHAFQVYRDGSAVKVRSGSVNSVVATGLDPSGEPTSLWLNVNISATDQSVQSVAVQDSEPTGAEDRAKLLIATLTWSDGVPTISQQISGSQSLVSCGETHVFGRV